MSLPIGAMLLIAVVPYQTWAHFSGTFPTWQAHRAALIAALIVLVLSVALRRIGCPPAKASVVAAFPVVAILFGQLSPVVPLVVIVVALVASLIDRQRTYQNAALALGVIGGVLFVGAASPVVRFTMEERQLVGVTPGSGLEIPDTGLVLTSKPSIIHIVLDGYGGTGPLAEIYGHDTGPFFDELSRRGFTVVEDVVTPYNQTVPSIASVMSAAPVDVSEYRGRSGALRRDLAHTIRHGPVPGIFEAGGYTIARGESGYGFVDFDDARRVTPLPIGLTPLDSLLFHRFADLFGPVHNDLMRRALEPGTLSSLPQPFFYYQHLVAPHPPFSIAADGSDLATGSFGYMDGNHFTLGMPERRASYVEGYRAKALFVEKALIAQIDAFPEGPKIVIIHGDHGPGAFLDHESAERTCMRERMRTFVAIYSDVPGVRARLLSGTERPLSIVNIYRAVLSSLSGAEMPFLSAESRFLRWSEPTETTPVSAIDLDRPCGAIRPARAIGSALELTRASGDFD